jgi:hypothetical protein
VRRPAVRRAAAKRAAAKRAATASVAAVSGITAAGLAAPAVARAAKQPLLVVHRLVARPRVISKWRPRLRSLRRRLPPLRRRPERLPLNGLALDDSSRL